MRLIRKIKSMLRRKSNNMNNLFDMINSMNARIDEISQSNNMNNLCAMINSINAKIDGILIPRQMTIEWETRQCYHSVSESLDRQHLFYKEIFNFLYTHFPELTPLRKNKELFLFSNHKTALESNDHLFPESTIEGIRRFPQLPLKMEKFFGKKIGFLDIGCGGGGLVFEFAMNGHLSIGLDGSDHCMKNSIGFWHLLPQNFFTCDVTKLFELKNENDLCYQFELITMWETLEHIQEECINSLLKNIKNHLKKDGFFIGSISLLEYSDPRSGVVYHVTLREKEFWRDIFFENGLMMLDEHPFHFSDFYRGIGKGYQDPHNYYTNPEAGFHFVAAIANQEKDSSDSC